MSVAVPGHAPRGAGPQQWRGGARLPLGPLVLAAVYIEVVEGLLCHIGQYSARLPLFFPSFFFEPN